MMDWLIPIITVVLLVLIGGAVFSGLRKERQLKAALREHGVKTTGVVMSRENKRRRNNNSDGTLTTDNSYYVEYRWTVKENIYSRRELVDSGRYSALPEGTEVEVVYLPETPTEAR